MHKLLLLATLGVGPGTTVLDKTQAQARQGLLTSYPDAAKQKVNQDVQDTVLGLKVARASAGGAYPGTGVVAVLLDPATGITYGAHGESDLADLARARGWLTRPPAAAELVTLFNLGQYGGLLMVDARAPEVETAQDGLVLRFVRGSFPSGARDAVTVTFPRQGKLTAGFTPER